MFLFGPYIIFYCKQILPGPVDALWPLETSRGLPKSYLSIYYSFLMFLWSPLAEGGSPRPAESKYVLWAVATWATWVWQAGPSSRRYAPMSITLHGLFLELRRWQ